MALFLNAQHFWQSYLYGYIAISALAIGSLGIFLLHNVVGGNWGVAIRRFIESGLQTLPMFALLVIPILFATGRSISGPTPPTAPNISPSATKPFT